MRYGWIDPVLRTLLGASTPLVLIQVDAHTGPKGAADAPKIRFLPGLRHRCEGLAKKRLAEIFDGLNLRLGSRMKDFGWPEAEFLYRHEGGRQRGP